MDLGYNFKVEKNVNIKNMTTVGIGGVAKYVMYPKSVKELKDCIEYCQKKRLRYVVLGNGSNTLFCTNYYKGAIISLKQINDIIFYQNTVKVMCGTCLNKLIKECVNRGLSGLEYFYGIPCTVGGLVYMNGGAFGRTVSDNLLSIEILRNGKIVKKNINELKPTYRSLNIKRGVIISATFSLNALNTDILQNNLKQIIKVRNNKIPKGKSLGCVFKNPLPKNAGYLIEKVQLKDYNINDAVVSNKHANFIINKNSATFKDYLMVIKHIKEQVEKRFGVQLNEEIKLIGNNKNDFNC